MKSRLFLLVIITASFWIHARILQVGIGLTYSNIQAATTAAIPGDTIIMNNGTYANGQWLENVKGTASAWIHIRAQQYGQVIVDGGSEAWHFVDPEYVRVWGITFQNQTGNGVNCDDGGTYATPAKHIIFDSCQWLGMNATGNNDELKLSGVDSFQIINCAFKNGSAGGSGIDMVGCHWGDFLRNRFENQGSNSIQAKGGSRFIRIERNLFINAGERAVNLGGSTGLAFFRPDTAHYEAADLWVYSNIFIGSNAPIAYVGCVNTDVINNTIFKPEHWVIRILQETVDATRFQPCGNNSFRNNIIYLADNLPTECNVGSNTAPSTFTFSNNLWFNYQNSSWTGPSDLPAADQNRIINQDPDFIDTSINDFSIPTTSPAAGAGFTVVQPTTDFTGKAFASPRSIGAYEANASVVDKKIRILQLINPNLMQVHSNQITIAPCKSYTRYDVATMNGKMLRHGKVSPTQMTFVDGLKAPDAVLLITLTGANGRQSFRILHRD
jgi:hypothetical protein